MIIKCKFNKGSALRDYEDQPLQPEQFGKFGASAYTEYAFEVGEEFFVVGMILAKGNLSYLINNGRVIGTYPYQLFEVVDSEIPIGWHFNAFLSNSTQATWGYEEWCFDSNHRDALIEMDEDAYVVFYRRKSELEQACLKQ